jgi:Tol biopolymer transport system component
MVGAFSVSPAGSITYRTGFSRLSQFTWFDQAGKVAGTIGTPDANGLLNPALSPDGRRVAAQRAMHGNIDLWLFDAGRETRLTFDAGRDMYPVWSPDGSRIAFSKELKGARSLYRKSSMGGGGQELLLASGSTLVPNAWSPDGRFLMYSERSPVTALDLWVLPLDGKQPPSVFLNSKFEERYPQFSPDGRWVAYMSDESGRPEIYLRPFPASSGQFPVSTTGGIAPRWRKDGKELYYIAPDSKLMAVSMDTTGRAPKMGEPGALFRPHILYGGTMTTGVLWQYDVAPDGRFLINVTPDDVVTAPITVIQNWSPRIKK